MSKKDALRTARSQIIVRVLPKKASNHKAVFVKKRDVDQRSKPASQKKKKLRSRVRLEIHDKFPTFFINFSSSRLTSGREVIIHRIQKLEYYITTDGDGCEWGVCDKDCGWCGRCILMEY